MTSGRLLDAYFSRAFYKQILGKTVDMRDLESIDPEYHKSLQWMLENDITDVIDVSVNKCMARVRQILISSAARVHDRGYPVRRNESGRASGRRSEDTGDGREQGGIRSFGGLLPD